MTNITYIAYIALCFKNVYVSNFIVEISYKT